MECRREQKDLPAKISKLKSLKRIFFIFTLLLSVTFHLASAEKILIEFKGSYLAYSYDFSQIYGEDIHFHILTYEVSCDHLKIDISARLFYAYGSVVLKNQGERFEGDEFFFNPEEKSGTLIRYKDTIEVKRLGSREGLRAPELEEEDVPFPTDVLETLTLSKIQSSLFYFTCEIIQVTETYEIFGEKVILHLEGLESVGFKKFKLSSGLKQRSSGFSLDKIWFTKSQGILARGSYLYRTPDRVNSLTQLNYEERSVLKDYVGPDRQVDILSSTSFEIDKDTNASLTGNYNSSKLWNASLVLNKRWSQSLTTNFDFSYNKPINFKGEAWFGFDSTLYGGHWGDLALAGRYEVQDQFLGILTYGKTFLERFSLLLNSTYSKIKIVGSDDYSEIFTGGVSLSYDSRVFNLSSDYYLNHDLFGSQLLSQPQLRVGINPFAFYGGILMASVTNIFIYSDLKIGAEHQDSYSNNTIFSLSTQPMHMVPGISLDMSVAVEQFLEKEDRNFTSGGFIGRATAEISRGFFLEGLYNFQSRRRTRDWLIEGTSSQDLSVIFRANPSNRLNSWISFSYDPKNGRWTQSFADISFEVIRKWKFHTLINYDFILDKLNNIDLFLVREAGRVQLRFVWRSLSKQFSVELIPR
jgi:hypothetical protein